MIVSCDLYGIFSRRSIYLPNVQKPEHPTDDDEVEALTETTLNEQDIAWLTELYSFGNACCVVLLFTWPGVTATLWVLSPRGVAHHALIFFSRFLL